MSTTTRPRPPRAGEPQPARGASSSQARFARRARAVRRRPWLVALVVVATVALAVAGVWLFWFSSLLAVRTVTVQTTSGPLSASLRQEIVALADVRSGTPLARLDPQQVATRVARQPLLAEVTVSRSYPHTVEVLVTPRQPVLAVRNPQGEVELVDRDGNAYQRAAKAPADLPQVTAAATVADAASGGDSSPGDNGPGENGPGDNGAGSATTPQPQLSPEALRAAIDVVRAIPADLRADVTKITVAGANLITLDVTAGKNRVTVTWGGSEQNDLKADVLAVLLRQKGIRTINVSAPANPVTT